MASSPKKTIKAASAKEIPVTFNAFLLIALSEGAAVLAVELASAKVLAPVFGNSLVVWTIILTVTLAGLAAGYFAAAADRFRLTSVQKIFSMMALASVFLLLLPVTSPVMLRWGAGLGLTAGAAFSACLVLLPPLFLLGMVPPSLVRLAGNTNEAAGDNAGKIFAVSTAGGVAAVFITGFWILPEFGVAGACRAAALFAGLLPFIMLVRSSKWLMVGVMAVAVLISVVSGGKKDKDQRYVEVYKSDGLLGQLTVVDNKQLGWRKLNINNISQSLMHIPTGRSQWKYVHRIAAYSSMKPEGSKVLIAGLGAGNLVNEMQLLGFEVDIVEIDKRMTEIAKRYFGMKENKVNVIIDDARHFIRTCKKKYDIIIIDLSAGEVMPSNLYTLEGFRDTKDILKNDGVLFLHCPGRISTGEYPSAVGGIGRTLNEAGFNTKMLNTFPKMNELSELIFFASPSGIDLRTQSFERRDHFAYPYRFPFKDSVYIDPVDFSKGELMTDNKPLMDHLHRENIASVRDYVLEETKGAKAK
jgi:predicted membrane-bound spermidine synthase